MPAVLIPFTGACRHRRAALDWVRTRYAEHHPDWQVQSQAGLNSGASNRTSEARFCKAALVNPLIEASDAEIVVVADADVWSDGLSAAVAAVKDGAPWAIPHDEVHRLSEQGTAAVLDGADWRDQTLVQEPYEGLAGGGIVVARRETLLDIPMDPRFSGWGQEDQSHAMALHFLAGQASRGEASLVHLWHPEPQRLTRKRGSPENWNLFRRYCRARSDLTALRQLVDEAKDVADRTAQPIRDDRQPV